MKISQKKRLKVFAVAIVFTVMLLALMVLVNIASAQVPTPEERQQQRDERKEKIEEIGQKLEEGQSQPQAPRAVLPGQNPPQASPQTIQVRLQQPLEVHSTVSIPQLQNISFPSAPSSSNPSYFTLFWILIILVMIPSFMYATQRRKQAKSYTRG